MTERDRRPLTLSAKETLILELLVRDGELYGLQMVAASKRRLKRGTVYVTLGRMEEKGMSHRGRRTRRPRPGACPAASIARRHSAAACSRPGPPPRAA